CTKQHYCCATSASGCPDPQAPAITSKHACATLCGSTFCISDDPSDGQTCLEYGRSQNHSRLASLNTPTYGTQTPCPIWEGPQSFATTRRARSISAVNSGIEHPDTSSKSGRFSACRAARSADSARPKTN